MWTKRYLLHPTKDEYFKTTHPIGSLCTISPLLIYYVLCTINHMDSPWLILGAVGCVLFGMGFAYIFAIVLKVYQKIHTPIIYLLLGCAITAASILLALR